MLASLSGGISNCKKGFTQVIYPWHICLAILLETLVIQYLRLAYLFPRQLLTPSWVPTNSLIALKAFRRLQIRDLVVLTRSRSIALRAGRAERSQEV